MMMTYEGKRDIETGRILADRVEFSKNDFEKGEARLWKDLKVKLKPGDALGFKPAELSISKEANTNLFRTTRFKNTLPSSGKVSYPNT
jgi:hypothetical protein